MIPSIAYGVWSVALFIKLLVFQELRYTPYMHDCFLTITLKNHLVFPVRFCKKKKKCLFLAVLGLCCCTGSRVVASGLLAAGAPVVAEHRVLGAQASVTAAPGSAAYRPIVLAPGLSCSAARGILPDQGSSLWLLHRQVGSPLLSPQGGPARLL